MRRVGGMKRVLMELGLRDGGTDWSDGRPLILPTIYGLVPRDEFSASLDIVLWEQEHGGGVESMGWGNAILGCTEPVENYEPDVSGESSRSLKAREFFAGLGVMRHV
jgi:hypothetical protein